MVTDIHQHAEGRHPGEGLWSCFPLTLGVCWTGCVGSGHSNHHSPTAGLLKAFPLGFIIGTRKQCMHNGGPQSSHPPPAPSSSLEEDRAQASGKSGALSAPLEAMQQAQRPPALVPGASLGQDSHRRGSLCWHISCVSALAGLGVDLAQMKTIQVGQARPLSCLSHPQHCSSWSQLHPHRPLGVSHTTPTFFHLGAFTPNAPCPPAAPSFP